MSDFRYQGPMRSALPETGLRTPAYYHSVEVITDDIRRVSTALGATPIMRLSDCPLPDVLSRLPADVRFGVVTASRPEMNMVIAWATPHAYIEAPALDQSLARAGLGASHRFVIEHQAQIEMLVALRGRREVQPVLLLVRGPRRPDRGMTRAQLVDAIAALNAAGIPLAGFACADRVGPDNAAWLADLADLAGALVADGALMLVPGTYVGPTEGAGVDAYGAAIAAVPARFQVVHFGGSAIFARSGVMATRVLHVDTAGETAFARCDIAMAQALPLAPVAGGLRVESRAWLLGDAPRAAGQCLLAGASGIEGDLFATLDFLPEPGDVILFDNCGAGVRTLSPVQHGGMGEVPVFLLGETLLQEAAE